MLKYINENIKAYGYLYLLNRNYQRITKKDIVKQENKAYKLSTLKKYYNSEEFDIKVENEKRILKEMKNLIAIAYILQIEPNNNLGHRGFSKDDLLQYKKEFFCSLIIDNKDEIKGDFKIKTIK